VGSRPYRYKGGRKAALKRSRLKHRDKIKARRRQYYLDNAESIRNKARDYRKQNLRRIVERNRPYLAEYRKRLRAEMIAAYGGACVCCGESTPQFLQLDHIYNDGASERRTERACAHPFWARLKKRGWPKDRYQLLCANCNFGKLINGGTCPHKSK
jgi:hypothetical protein